MKKETKAINIVCDCCGRILRNVKGEIIFGNPEITNPICHNEVEDGWYMNFNTNKDYCPSCWHIEEKQSDGAEDAIPFVVTNNGEQFEYEW